MPAYAKDCQKIRKKIKIPKVTDEGYVEFTETAEWPVEKEKTLASSSKALTRFSSYRPLTLK